MSKATEWASRLSTRGSTLLSTFQKGDTEYLAAMRQAQERQLMDLGEEISKNQWRAADWDLQALNEQMESALRRLRYYQGLINGGLNLNESSYVISTYTSMSSRGAAQIAHATAAENVQEPNEHVEEPAHMGLRRTSCSCPAVAKRMQSRRTALVMSSRQWLT
jgi:hypothetical protein